MRVTDIKELFPTLPFLRHLVPKSPGSSGEVPGVYLLQYSEYFYVGMASNLQHRLAWHLKASSGEVVDGGGVSPKYWSVLRKHRSAPRVFLLESGDKCKDPRTRSMLERMWILVFWNSLGSKRMMNVVFDPSVKQPRTPRLKESTRLERSIKMSQTIRLAHQDPDYKAKMRKVASENWRKLPSKRRAELNAETGIRSRAHFKDPQNVERQSKSVSRQWKDPKFQQANRERLTRLRESGWKPKPALVVKVRLPDGSEYVLLQNSLIDILGLGGRKGGPLKIFDSNPLLADWSVTVVGSVAGHLRASRQEELDSNLGEFEQHPFVRWVVSHKKKYPKLFALRPVSFMVGRDEYRALNTTSIRSAGRTLKEGAHSIERYPTLYEFARSKLPLSTV